MDTNTNTNGMLYICATPIGNLEDITLRVLRVLKEVNFIAAEDTRHTAALLNHFEIRKPLISYHDHNKREKGKIIIDRLQNGESAALVTDAGMPCISDPGYELVQLCLEYNLPFTVCPGASAAITALALSGLKTERFCFEGFLPAPKKEREVRIKSIINETRTTIIYEAPHRLLSTLKELEAALGCNRNAAVVREITKMFEETARNTLSGLCSYFAEKTPKGEFVILIDGKSGYEIAEESRNQWLKLTIDMHMQFYLDKGMDKKEAIKAVAKDRGVPKNEIYMAVNC